MKDEKEMKKPLEVINFNKSDPDIDGVLFCIKALEKTKRGDHAQITTSLYVENGEMVSTDGHRMHVYKLNDPVKEGHYTVLQKSNVSILLQKQNLSGYPPWKTVFPECMTALIPNCYFDTIHDVVRSYVKIIRNLPDGIGLNYKYLEDLEGDGYDVSIGTKDLSFPINCMVLCKSISRKALIMTMKVDSPKVHDFSSPDPFQF